MSLSAGFWSVLGAVLLGMAGVWLIRETGDPAGSKERGHARTIKPVRQSRRDELLEGRAKIQRQIEVLQSPAGGPSYQNAPPDVSAEIAELQKLLDGINRELALNHQ